MLDAKSISFFSGDFGIYEGDVQVATIHFSSLSSEEAELTVQDSIYRASRSRRHSVVGDYFTLHAQDGSDIASGKRVGILLSKSEDTSYEFKFGQFFYSLEKIKFLSREFVLFDANHDRQIGFVSPNSWFTNNAKIDLPTEIPLAVKVFIFWCWLLDKQKGGWHGGGDGGGE